MINFLILYLFPQKNYAWISLNPFFVIVFIIFAPK